MIELVRLCSRSGYVESFRIGFTYTEEYALPPGIPNWYEAQPLRAKQTRDPKKSRQVL